jgi:hypothetical protein|tara:strand:- start:94 stop:273 length:180 start_codon:yes stop_codon:yes gene_type:complete
MQDIALSKQSIQSIEAYNKLREMEEAVKRVEKRIVKGKELLKTKSLFQVIQIMKTKKDI